MERWQREAEALAALNDDRISAGGATGDGESLDVRLARSRLTPAELYPTAIAIAAALEAPHRLGILHRRLSAANVWLRPNGAIQLLHFGSAHARAAAAGSGSSVDVPLSNEPDDPRSDILAFGSVLAAMAAPKPDRGLRHVIHRCLEHNPDHRYQSAQALREDLERLQAKALAGARHRGVPWRLVAFAAIALLIGAITVWKLASMPSGPLPVPDLSFSQITFTANIAAAALSPDGQYLATVHRDLNGDSLHLRALAAGGERLLVPDGAGCCSAPSVAPSGNWVDFLADGHLWSIPRAGDGMRMIAPAARSGAGFSPSGARIAYIDGDGHLVVADADGSHPRSRSSSQFASVTPSWSPDGQHIAAIADGTVMVFPAASGAPARFPGATFDNVSGLTWLPTGRGLLLTAARAPHAAQQVWQLSWPTGVLAQVTSDRDGYAGLTASRSGTLALVQPAPQAAVWVQSAPGGTFAELPSGGLTRAGMEGVAWLSNQSLLVTHVFHHDHQLWTLSTSGANAGPVALKGAAGALLAPLVTRGGPIVFLARSAGAVRLWRANPDGSGAVALTPPLANWAALGLIRNGKQVEFFRNHQLWTVPVSGGPRQLLWNHAITNVTNVASSDGSHILVFAPTPTLLTLGPGLAITASTVALDPATMLPPYAFTPDGRAVTFVRRRGSVENLWAIPLAGGAPHPLTRFSSGDIFAYAFSRDGRLALSRGSMNPNALLAHGLSSR